MIFVRIILGIIAFPFMVLAYLLHYFFRLVVILGAKIVLFISTLVILGGIILMLFESCSEPAFPGDKGDLKTGILALVIGIVGCFLPYIGAFISEFFRYIAEWIKYKAYH